jgi:glutamate-5-semialdehyde dehydrogenase
VSQRLQQLQVGQLVLFGGDRVTEVSAELAGAFVAGDRVVVVQATGDLLHIPAEEHHRAAAAVARARSAFAALADVDDTAISAFFSAFADRLADDGVFAAIAAANQADVEMARSRGRSTTRLVLSDSMRAGMIAGLRTWAELPGQRDALVDTVEHQGWRAELRRAPLGVIGFVFEGRPNVFADATGVLRTGNTVVFRIGSDALGTARAIVRDALDPALRAAGLPDGAAVLLDSASRSAGWALFEQPDLDLAVARGSGHAVAQLASVARQAGVPVSLHGTGGGWIVAGAGATPEAFEQAVYHSLDRKVCNTVNVICLPRTRLDDLGPVLRQALEAAGSRRGGVTKLHLTEPAVALFGTACLTTMVEVERADGTHREPWGEVITPQLLGTEWEWEQTPEVSVCVVDDTDEAVEWFNAYSPRLVASLVSSDPHEQQRFWSRIDAPFVGNGFTRWVDGQFALDKPELGLSNWESGRLFSRSGVLSGDSAYTVRVRAVQDRPDIHR